MSTPIYEKLQKCVEAVRNKTDFVPDVALVLGSGLGGFAENIKIETEISYSDISGFNSTGTCRKIYFRIP